jgi:hypothetical protein
VPPFDIIYTVSEGKATRPRAMCNRCLNENMARAIGLDFQHHDFEPFRIVDCQGKSHEFHFTRMSISAFEVRRGERAGYEFQAIDGPENDQLVLLGRLIEKIRRALAVKYLEDTPEGRRIAEFVVQGAVEWDEYNDGVPLMIIDGREITWDEFGRMLMTYEGWQFRLEIRDKSEEFETPPWMISPRS